MNVAAPETLFGLSRVLSPDETRHFAAFLSAAWSNQAGRPPASMENDLAYLKRLFSPTAAGRRLRTELSRLPVLPQTRPRGLPVQMFLATPDGRGLVTPEGRVALTLLEGHLVVEQFAFDTDEVAWAYRVVADLYRDWGRSRLLEALGLKGGALRLPVIAFNLFLLVNGSIGPNSALPIPDAEAREKDLSGVIGTIIDAFDGALRSTRRRTESFRLKGGWIVTETSRQLFDYVAFESRGISIRQGQVAPLVARLAAELARNPRVTAGNLAAAYDELVAAHARARPALAARGIAHERTSETKSLRMKLLTAFEHSRDEPADI